MFFLTKLSNEPSFVLSTGCVVIFGELAIDNHLNFLKRCKRLNTFLSFLGLSKRLSSEGENSLPTCSQDAWPLPSTTEPHTPPSLIYSSLPTSSPGSSSHSVGFLQAFWMPAGRTDWACLWFCLSWVLLLRMIRITIDCSFAVLTLESSIAQEKDKARKCSTQAPADWERAGEGFQHGFATYITGGEVERKKKEEKKEEIHCNVKKLEEMLLLTKLNTFL